MTEKEAHELAKNIRTCNPAYIDIQEITSNSSNGSYQIRCCYTGPTIKTEFHLFLHNMEFWISAPYQWALLKKGLGNIS